MTDTSTLDVASDAGAPHRDRPTRRSLALVGAVSAAFTLGFGALVAAVYEEPSPVDNVATAVIAHSPEWFVKLGIDLFGTNDKLALGIGVIVITVTLGAALARPAWEHRWLIPAAYGVLAAVGFLAALDRPDANGASAAMILLVAVGAGIGLHLLLFWILGREATAVADDGVASRATDRRWFLGVLTGAAIAAGASALWARSIVNQVAVAARNAIGLPIAVEAAPPVPSDASLAVAGITPIVTPNSDFYRIDTAFVTPRINPQGWELGVTGLVDSPFSLSYDDLLNLPMVERHVTIACVSNEVGGDLIGNAKWLGVPLADVLDRARPTAEAEQVVGRSVDGFTAGFPIDLAFDGRDALVAVAMNDEPLPFAHGFPARLVVEGVYGYVSATKWLEEIELTTWDGFDGYWIPRGWAKLGPVKTQSRIDVPRTRAVPSGPTVVAGVAWAQTRGVERVEVRVDGGAWQDAELAEAINDGTWRQWRTTVDLEVGEHAIEVRATDGAGETQTQERRPPDPDGATGYHARFVEAA